jgi:hypothetical protein
VAGRLNPYVSNLFRRSRRAGDSAPYQRAVWATRPRHSPTACATDSFTINCVVITSGTPGSPGAVGLPTARGRRTASARLAYCKREVGVLLRCVPLVIRLCSACVPLVLLGWSWGDYGFFPVIRGSGYLPLPRPIHRDGAQGVMSKEMGKIGNSRRQAASHKIVEKRLAGVWRWLHDSRV